MFSYRKGVRRRIQEAQNTNHARRTFRGWNHSGAWERYEVNVFRCCMNPLSFLSWTYSERGLVLSNFVVIVLPMYGTACTVCTGHESFEGNLFSSYAPLAHCTGLKIACCHVWFSFTRHGSGSGFMTVGCCVLGLLSNSRVAWNIALYFADTRDENGSGNAGLFRHYWTIQKIVSNQSIKYFEDFWPSHQSRRAYMSARAYTV